MSSQLTDTARATATGDRTARRSFPAAHGFWVIGVVFAVAMAFSTVPAPLYAFYRQRDGFSTFMITVIFAAYAVGVIGSLFLAGHTSDWLGRRRLRVGVLFKGALATVRPGGGRGSGHAVWTQLKDIVLQLNTV